MTRKDGSYGEELLRGIKERFDKLQVPGQPRLIKALPKPDDKPRRKRGGQKYRSMRERFKMTSLRKMRNTIAFGPEA